MPDVSSALLAVPTDLQGAGTHINSVAAELENELLLLKNQLAPLIEQWQGVAGVDYQGLQQEWNVAADGLFGPNGVLGAIAQTMNLNWNNYTDCESANVQTWRR